MKMFSLSDPTPHPLLTRESPQPSPQEALEWLLRGNQRYLGHRSKHPRQSSRARLKVAQGQHPFAVVLGCADSRVVPEVIFDQGLGDLFVVRVAGHCVDNAVLASLEFAVSHFGVPLIVVLGHNQCGAMQAALEASRHPVELPQSLGRLVKTLLPRIAQARDNCGQGAEDGVILNCAIDLHIQQIAQTLLGDKTLARRVQKGQLKVVGGRYDLYSGTVELGFEPSLSEKPRSLRSRPKRQMR